MEKKGRFHSEQGSGEAKGRPSIFSVDDFTNHSASDSAVNVDAAPRPRLGDRTKPYPWSRPVSFEILLSRW
jgi:hypothetical protein